MKRSFAIFLAVCLLLAVAGCGGRTAGDAGAGSAAAEAFSDGSAQAEAAEAKSPVDGMTVAFIPGDAGDAYSASAYAGAEKYAAEWGLNLLCPEGAQADAVRLAIEAGAKGICIAAGDSQALGDALREAREAGVCACTWAFDTAPEDRALTVSQGTAGVLAPMLVEMGATSLKERGFEAGGAVSYLWRSAQADDADAQALYAAAKDYIGDNYPDWSELAEPCWSGADDEATAVSRTLLEEHADVDLILCGDPIALPGQCRAAMELGRSAEDVTITGFCPPSRMRQYLDAGVCTRWGLWDCGLQGAMCCYLAAWLAAGNEVCVGDIVNIPRIGSVEVLANSELIPGAETAPVNNGVVLLPERIVFTAENVADYHF